MATMTKADPTDGLEARIHIEDSKALVYLSSDQTRDLRASQVEALERALVQANASYAAGLDDHEHAKQMLWAAENVSRLCDVIYWLTPVPNDEIDD